MKLLRYVRNLISIPTKLARVAQSTDLLGELTTTMQIIHGEIKAHREDATDLLHHSSSTQEKQLNQLTDLISMIKNNTDDLRSSIHHIGIEEYLEKLRQSPRYSDPKKLNRYEVQVYSQNGEDGILQEIFNRIWTTDRRFVEIGTADGLENNTAFLLLKEWSGCWIEAHPHFCRKIREKFGFLIQKNVLHLEEAFLTVENVNSIFERATTPTEFDLLSMDIDGNDYWLWKALDQYRPRVVVIEYNGLFPPDTSWIMAYDPKHVWRGSRHYGASLLALTDLALAKGYCLVGCEFTGNNAFFVRQDLVGNHFSAPYSAEHHYEPSRHFLVHSKGYRRDFGPFVQEQLLAKNTVTTHEPVLAGVR